MDYIHLPNTFMREGPSEKTKVVSEALFAEEVKRLEDAGSWVLIKTPDAYTGWVEKKRLVSRKPYLPTVAVTRLAAHLYSAPDIEFGAVLTLPYGARLEIVEEKERFLTAILPDERVFFIQKGDVAEEVFNLHSFLGIPYTWGGRSSFGFDCSGFVQMVFAKFGLQLPRDAKQQVLLGKEVSEFQFGDLIFWGKSENEIGHVGIYLEEGNFIHTSSRENKPYVRVSSFTDLEWSGSGFYKYRTGRRLLREDPKEKECSCHFGADQHE